MNYGQFIENKPITIMTDINGQTIYHFHPNNSTIFNLIWDKFDGVNSFADEILEIHAVDKKDALEKINTILANDNYGILHYSINGTEIYA